MGHMVRLVALTAALTCLFALINPVPAAAHIVGTGGTPTNYRTTVTAIRPAVPVVAVAVGLGGEWTRVTNKGAATIVVLGYRGEPFLRLTGNQAGYKQAEYNQSSSTATQTGLTQRLPGAAGSAPGTRAAEPRWVQISDGDSVTWVDARIAAPRSGQASGSWELPLLVDGRRVTAMGTRDLVAPPSPWPWIAVLMLLIAGVAALGWRRDWHRPMAYVLAVGIVAFVLHVVGTGFEPQQSGIVVGWVSVALVAGFSMVVGAVGLISTVYRRESAPDRLVTVGAMVLLLAATDLTGLWNSQLPFPGPAVLDRVLTVLTYGVALGVIVAGLRLVRVAKAARAALESAPPGA